uniref:Brp/Blh family beta-carotene 15,15'-dioxygenase n=2 Tax=Flavobacterium sp. TaxID=239 RepID=UPI00404B89D7
MSNFTKFSVVASFVGLWINSFINEKAQIVIGFLLIFTFGILHGANDLLLIQKTNGVERSLNFKKILIYYISVVILGALLFYFLPSLALLIFIVASGYHFGEQHWHEITNNDDRLTNKLFYLAYGLTILGLVFVFHVEEVQLIIREITNNTITEQFIENYFYGSLVAFGLLLLLKVLKSSRFQKELFQELFLLLVFAILFKTSSLIWGFALYFILWHSIPSLKDQITFLYGDFSFIHFKKYFRAAFLYWIFALIGIFGLYYLLRNEQIFDALFFSFLAAITFPHVWVIVSMFENKKGEI